MNQQFNKLKALLQELFQLDQPDLDFGLYRIMHAKSAEVSQFLDKELLPQVQAAFGAYRTADKAELERELAKAIEQAQDLGVDPEATQKVKELRARLASEAVDVGGLEREVYDHLYTFFRRYYSEGDYLAKRVYKPGVYAIPYEGEEVTLHWANKDQYYIKTSEYLRNYVFRVRPDDPANPMRVHFRLVDAAEGEHGNVKAAEGRDRRFKLAVEQPLAVENGELVIRFTYLPEPKKQAELNAEAEATVLATTDPAFADWVAALKAPAPTEKDPDRTVLAKHLKGYSDRNTFDYFIHKDLGGFLRRELDFYIKNEVMHLDDVESETAPRVEQYLSKIKVIRRIAGKIIDFLAQLEDFQKKLWLKKKFVVETSYCIRLGVIPEEFYPEIAANEAQREEWVALCGIDALDRDLSVAEYSVPLTAAFLKAHPSLIVDTTHFEQGFVARLLDALGDINEQQDGVLFHSENFQALSLMTAVFRERIALTYIDPPYNTGSDGFAYKDNYQHSSWMSALSDRIAIGRSLTAPDGAMLASINDNESRHLEMLLRELWGTSNYQARLAIKVRHEDRILRRDISYQEVMEDVHLTAKSPAFKAGRRRSAAAEDAEDTSKLQYKFSVGLSTAPSETLEIGGYVIEVYPVGTYTIASHAEGDASRLKRYTIRGSLITQKGSASEYYERHLRARRPIDGFGCLYKVIGMGVRGDGIGHRFILQPTEGEGDNGIYFQGMPLKGVDDSLPYPTFLDMEAAFNRCADEGGVQFRGGKKPLALLRSFFDMTGCAQRTTSTTLDYFAGSGTTGHAVIDLNREDGGRRKFILVEMGDYFDTVLLPRIKKVAFTPEWKDGKPKRLATPEEAERSPRIVKVVRMESYEDTLNNLETRRTDQQQFLLQAPEAQGAERLREEYLLRYMLNVETRGSQSLLNVQGFTDPTAYRLKVKRPGSDESREMNVDLLETFNWLLGLTVGHIAAPKTFAAAFKRDDDPDLPKDAPRRLLLDGHLREATDGPWWFRTVTGTTPDDRKALVVWRKLTGDPEQDNLVLDEWFTKQGYSAKDSEFDLIYVNGGNNLENLKTPDDRWKVRLIEEDFHRLMFEGTE